MTRAIILTLILLATPAAAEFTDAEKANVHSLILNINLIRSGLQDQIFANNYTGYLTAWQAAVDCHDAVGYLFGIQLKQGTSDRNALASYPRATWLVLAWGSLDRCINGLASAHSEASAVTNKYWQARVGVLAFPRSGISLLYQSPKPLTYPTVVGPHGDYDFAQENFWFAIKYAHDSLIVYGSRYLCDYANYLELVQGALANVRFTAGETADHFDTTIVDSLSNVLWLQKFALKDTAVKALAAAMNEYQQAQSQYRLIALEAETKAFDSWKNYNVALWDTLCIDGRVSCDRTPH